MGERVRVIVPPALDGERVDRVVSFLTGVARAEASTVIEAGGVVLGGRVAAARSRRVVSGEVLEVHLPDRPAPPSGDPLVALAIVHADDAVAVVDKPAGLVVHPGAGNREGTLVQGLLARFPDMAGLDWPDRTRPGIVHRLDKGTSGLLMVARNPAALGSLAAQLGARTVERRYLALVWGRVEPASGAVDAPLGRSAADPTRMAVRSDGRRAVTRYEVVEAWSRPQPTSLLRCTLETGRTHQIRVHLAAIGHPVVGDERYLRTGPGAGGRGTGGGPSHGEAGEPRRGRQRRGAVVAPGLGPGRPFLHAAVLALDHPVTGERLRFESGLPPDLQAVLDDLG